MFNRIIVRKMFILDCINAQKSKIQCLYTLFCELLNFCSYSGVKILLSTPKHLNNQSQITYQNKNYTKT